MNANPQKLLPRLLVLPENRSAYEAVRAMAAAIGRERLPLSCLMLHGPSGTGKSRLAALLAQEASRQRSLTIHQISGNDLREHFGPRRSLDNAGAKPIAAAPDPLGDAARTADLAIFEDLGHLPAAFAEALTQVLEERQSRDLPSLCTAGVGPRGLQAGGERVPARLASRLAAGLVVGLTPWQSGSRLLFLEELAQQRQLAVAPAILRWLAEALPGSRPLEGALAQLDSLVRLKGRPLTLAEVQEHFGAQVEAGRSNVEKIAKRVAEYFHLAPRQLRSACRVRSVLRARQVGMFLARQLTTMTMSRIGAFFGGRDHTTVLHSCRQVERFLEEDAHIGGAVQQLQAELC